jgi:hypothetical protein
MPAGFHDEVQLKRVICRGPPQVDAAGIDFLAQKAEFLFGWSGSDWRGILGQSGIHVAVLIDLDRLNRCHRAPRSAFDRIYESRI